LIAFLSTIPLHLIFQYFFPEMNYFVRAGWVIAVAFSILFAASAKNGMRSWSDLIQADSRAAKQFGIGLAVSLVVLHLVFH